jgi:hypothetical protein
VLCGRERFSGQPSNREDHETCNCVSRIPSFDFRSDFGEKINVFRANNT